MPNRSYNRSAARERELVNRFREQGKVAFRTRASKGPCDVIVLAVDEPPQFIEVKTGGRYPFEHFRPADRARLLDTANRAGARAVLFWWPGDSRGLQIIEPEAWPA